MKFKVIFASVKTDITDTVVDAAKTAGATGATIILVACAWFLLSAVVGHLRGERIS